VLLHDQAAARPQPIAQMRRERAAKGVLASASLLMQEVGAPQTHPDLGMATEPDQFGLLVYAVAAPALQRLCCV